MTSKIFLISRIIYPHRLVCRWPSTTVACYGIVDFLLHCLSCRNWMLIWLFDCNLDSYCVQYNIFSVSRKQFADISSISHHFFRQPMNRFAVMLQTHNIGWGIDWFLHFFVIHNNIHMLLCIRLHSYKQLFRVVFFALDKNEKLKFQKPCLRIL